MSADGRTNAHSGSHTATSRRDYLEEIAERLWPDPTSVTFGRGGFPHSDAHGFILVPHARQPRLLVPVTRRTAARAVRHYAAHDSVRGRLPGRVLSWALASGLGAGGMRDRLWVRRPAGTATIETHLQQVLGRDVQVSMHVGPPRANRKPVLQLLARDGRTIAYAKVGVNTLTKDLLRAERTALTELADARLRLVTVPHVLHYGRWNDLDVLVVEALPIWRRQRRLDNDRLTEATWEIARVGGIRRFRLADSPYWRSLRSRLAQLRGDDAPHRRVERGALDTAAGLVSARAGDEELWLGSWHGDWAPWNMAALPETLLAWDWERFGPDVPLGFDSLHHCLQTAIVKHRRQPGPAAAECVTGAGRLLEPFGLGSRQARLVAVLYLLEIAVRYLWDGQSEAGARLGDLDYWLLPALDGGVAEL